ncbi:MAG: DUF4962 domain-containing protein [Chloroflexaceae bacterium]|nr:DUF4962 domain-containing protein [Chloroflexaceae bacterium]
MFRYHVLILLIIISILSGLVAQSSATAQHTPPLEPTPEPGIAPVHHTIVLDHLTDMDAFAPILVAPQDTVTVSHAHYTITRQAHPVFLPLVQQGLSLPASNGLTDEYIALPQESPRYTTVLSPNQQVAVAVSWPGLLQVSARHEPGHTNALRVVLEQSGLAPASGSTQAIDPGDEQQAALAGTNDSLRINFQDWYSAVPPGYRRDVGYPFGPRTNDGSVSYGWVDPATGEPLDLSQEGTTPGNGRDRGFTEQGLDQRFDSLVFMQSRAIENFNGTPRDAIWEVAVPNGLYHVIVAAGDPVVDWPQYNPHHIVNVEGTPAIDFTATGRTLSANRASLAGVVVRVNDGRLTLDANGGYLTRINWVDIVPLVEQDQPLVYRVNFQSDEAEVPAGYLRDSGQPFDWRSDEDQGAGTLQYGWVDPIRGEPLDLSGGNGQPGNGRDRDYSPQGLDQRLDTVMHMQADDYADQGFAGTTAEGTWEMMLPNGRYSVMVVAGDPVVDWPDNVPHHVINVERIRVIDHIPQVEEEMALTRFAQGHTPVTIRDGRLTIDATGGFGTRIALVEVVRLDAPPEPTPTATATLTPSPTHTPIPPTATATRTPVPPTATATRTPVPPTATATPLPPTATATPLPQPTSTARPTTPPPTGDGSHPRLLAGWSGVSEVRQRASDSHAALLADLQAYAESWPYIPSRDPNVASHEYRPYGDTVGALAFVCMATDRDDHCTTAKSHLLTFVSWPSWDQGDWRDFGLGHGLVGAALAYDWIYPRLSESERATVRRVLGERAQLMHEAAIQDGWVWNNWWRRGFMQNHNHTNYAGLGLAGLALLGEDDRAQQWIDTATDNMRRLGTILDGGDGSWQEGLMYGDYGISMALAFSVNLRAVQGIDVVPYTFLQRYTLWRIYNYIPGSRDFLMAYGDLGWDWSHEGRALSIVRQAARDLRNGQAEWVAQRIEAEMEQTGRYRGGPTLIHTAFEFFAYDPSVTAESPAMLPLARVFPDLEGVIWRTGWERDDLVFGLKVSPTGGRFAFDAFTQGRYPFETGCEYIGCGIHYGHYHNDAGTFYLQRGPDVLAREYEAYQAVETFYHNTLLIDEQGQYRVWNAHQRDLFRGSDGFLEATASTNRMDYVAADLTRTYQRIDGLQDVTRHVVFVRPGYFLMVDAFRSSRTHQVSWISHVEGSVSTSGNWIRTNAPGDAALGIQVLSTDIGIQNGYDGRPYVKVAAAGQDMRLVHLLVPTTDSAWGQRPTATVVADSGGALLVRVTYADGSSDDILIAYAGVGNQQIVGDYTFNGKVAVVQRTASGQATQLSISGATFLRYQGSTLADNLNRMTLDLNL